MSEYNVGDSVIVKMHKGGKASGKIAEISNCSGFTHYTIRNRRRGFIIAIRGRETMCAHECEIIGLKS